MCYFFLCARYDSRAFCYWSRTTTWSLSTFMVWDTRHFIYSTEQWESSAWAPSAVQKHTAVSFLIVLLRHEQSPWSPHPAFSAACVYFATAPAVSFLEWATASFPLLLTIFWEVEFWVCCANPRSGYLLFFIFHDQGYLMLQEKLQRNYSWPRRVTQGIMDHYFESVHRNEKICLATKYLTNHIGHGVNIPLTYARTWRLITAVP